MHSSPEQPRHFLLLQGLRSPFFERLALGLTDAGHTVTKVHYNVGDHLYWWAKEPSWLDWSAWLAARLKLKPTPKQASHLMTSIRCQVPETELDGFYQQVFDDTGATDMVLFGDCRPIHRPAIELARGRGIDIHVFEEGYFRPDWVTLERGGVNGFSKLPANPDWYFNVARALKQAQQTGRTDIKQWSKQPSPISVGPSLGPRICHDVIYNVSNLFNRVFYPHYKPHTPHSIVAEYAAYITRFVRLQWVKKRDRRLFAQLLALTGSHARPDGHRNATRYFLVALQIPGDAQLDFHSGYGDTHQFIAEVMTSFCQHAPDDCLLVFKNHPLDPGLQRHDRVVTRLAQAMNCHDRVRFLETGHLPTLLDHAAGLVAVNSTTIGQAMFHRCPAIALGNSMYALPGLTFQGPLDDFWTQAVRPDMDLYQAFKQVTIYSTQINGGLYSRSGIEIAVNHAVAALLARQSKLEALLEAFPLQQHQSP